MGGGGLDAGASMVDEGGLMGGGWCIYGAELAEAETRSGSGARVG